MPAPQETSLSPRPVAQLEQKLGRLIGRCIEDWGLIEDGDKVMVGISGGKDSYTLLHMLERMQRVAPIRFELLAFHLDQAQPGFPSDAVGAYLATLDVPYVVHRVDTYSIVVDKLQPGQTTCSLCSRLRRGIMYTQAVELGCTKIALGHHRDDTVETVLMSMLYSGQLKAMPAKLRSDDRRNVVIRPLLYAPESLIVEFATAMQFPVLPCTVCSQQPDHRRAATKTLLDQLEQENPNIRGNLLAALSNVVESHLLDKRLFDPTSASVSDEDFAAALTS